MSRRFLIQGISYDRMRTRSATWVNLGASQGLIIILQSSPVEVDDGTVAEV